ncbi:Alpha/Beta hydrolase protein [Trichoderma ceciliae]
MTFVAHVPKANGQKKSENGKLLAEARNLTQTELWKKVEKFFKNVYGPSFGKLSGAEDLAVSPDGKCLAFTGQIWTSLEMVPESHVYLLDLPGETRLGFESQPIAVTQGQHTNKKPKWSPDGKTLAFLSDRVRKGKYELFSLKTDRIGDALQLCPDSLEGVVEDFAWSHDGQKILIGLAAFSLPKSGFEGSGPLIEISDNTPAWMPALRTDHTADDVRSLWIHEIQSGQTRRVSQLTRNVWKFGWCGLHEAIALVSDAPREGAYKESALVRMSLHDGSESVIIPQGYEFFIGQPTASSSGSAVAFIESVGGDRTKLAGSIVCIDLKTGNEVRITPDVDVSAISWTSEETLSGMGLRDLTSVALEVNILTRSIREVWSTTNACGPSYPQPTMTPSGGFVVVRHGWKLPHEIGIISKIGDYRKVLSINDDGKRWLTSQLGESQAISWKAPDGLDIQGYLYLPPGGQKPHPLVLNVHGGPISAFVDQWMGYRGWVAFLVTHGYAVLNPNPRGSLSRGRAFTQMVIGDVGGGDAQDLLSGLDYLVSKGIADPSRLGVIGGSYGGYQSAWLTTLTDRFAASIPISPVSDWNLQWLSSDVRELYLDNKPYDMAGMYFSRSALRHVHRCKTPTLQLIGSLDSCTPPPQAHYYHTALVDHGIKSCIVEYPLEGHGIRRFPALIDACCRMFSWFDHYMPVDK